MTSRLPDPGANGQGDSIFGHVSGRLTGSDRFWMKGAVIGLREVTTDDMILVSLDGQVTDDWVKPLVDP